MRLFIPLLIFLTLTGCVASVGTYQQGYDVGYQRGLEECTSKPIASNCLRNPTFVQLMEFLRQDPCDRCAGNCVDRATCLAINIQEAGFEAYTVLLNDVDGNGHVILGFQTTDKGFVYVEPAYDMVVRVELGKDYAKQLGDPKPFILRQIGIIQ